MLRNPFLLQERRMPREYPYWQLKKKRKERHKRIYEERNVFQTPPAQYEREGSTPYIHQQQLRTKVAVGGLGLALSLTFAGSPAIANADDVLLFTHRQQRSSQQRFPFLSRQRYQLQPHFPAKSSDLQTESKYK